MSFNINETLAQMAAAVKGTVTEDWPQVKQVTNQFLTNRKERLSLLSDLTISGDITKDQFLSRLEDEKLCLQAELHAVAVVGLALAQKAANAAIDVLENAVMKALHV